ncbi:hypothetical protein LCGC14_0876630 [marine sediment metagenome]|uniref:Uncharacterized protein n=1 Tax=marine sediment metagenome TaxID=412755 RepID=A0A0F9RMS7_9ZZZZ|nr:hypothetical protein [bacterium]
MVLTEEDVHYSIGSLGIEQFDTIQEIKDYFTRESFIDVFGECMWTDYELYDLTNIALEMWNKFVRIIRN